MTLTFRAQEAFAQQRPFVLFRKPNADCCIGGFQQNNQVFETNLEAPGWVFCPFDQGKSIVLPLDECQWQTETWVQQPLVLSEAPIVWVASETERQQHIALVQKAIDQMKITGIQKIVLSRKESHALSHFPIAVFFENLCQTYPQAYCYVFYHPAIGLWAGASPEVLALVHGQSLQTMSLAGTQLWQDGTKRWGAKEQQEQQLVTDSIVQQLKPFAAAIQVSEAQTVQAGMLAHLKSTIQIQLQADQRESDWLKALHPTPAVCGLPTNEARAFILNHEGYNRAYYTGFFGERGCDLAQKIASNQSHYQVNLRCLSWANDQVHFYAGGGILPESVPVDEFAETANKMQVMKQVLAKSIN
jgi:isochorismate synthase